MNLLQTFFTRPNSWLEGTSILLYTLPAMDISVIPLKSFICFEAFLGIGIMMFSRHRPGLVVHLECSMYLVDC